MPKTRVQLLKRQIAHAHLAIDRAIAHIAVVEDPFNQQHPELAEPLQMVCVGLDELNKVLEAWCYKVWGKEEIDWTSWANVPNDNTTIKDG